MSASRPRLVVFSDDWGRHPSSAQHLVRELLGRYEVDWVNTIGTRRPRLSLHDLARAREKLRAWSRPGPRGRQVEPSGTRAPQPCIHAPIHWPGFGSRLERWLNLRLLRRALRGVLESQDAPAAVLTSAPIPADLARELPHLNWVYYCVDDLSEWPGLDADALRTLERDMLPHMRHVVAVSDNLVERLTALGARPELLTHGIDLELWSGVERRTPPSASERPRAVYWGHADRRLDSPACLALARELELVMVGPTTDVDPALLAHPHIHWRGKVPYEELPAVASGADVLVMPYADLPVTRAMQPLKLKEYLATGLPVVAAPLPANLAWRDAMDLADSPEEFTRLALERARTALPARQVAAREALEEERWSAKAARLEALVLGDEA